MITGYITHPDCYGHEMIAGHPESPARLAAIEDRLIASGLMGMLRHYDAPRATLAQLGRVHDASFVDKLIGLSPTEGLVHIDPDTYMNPLTITAALHAAGAVVLAVDLVMKAELNNAFCSVRPPGHHATRDQAMGFCFFNNLAVGVAHALEQHGLNRVAVIDFDVHYGNGTADIFKYDQRVLICASHEQGLYPVFGDASDGHSNEVSLCLPARGFAARFRADAARFWWPRIEQFKPEMIFVSAGFDGHIEDDMSSANLTESDFDWATREIIGLAARFSANRVVSALEGGYMLNALGRSAARHIQGLLFA